MTISNLKPYFPSGVHDPHANAFMNQRFLVRLGLIFDPVTLLSQVAVKINELPHSKRLASFDWPLVG